MKMPAQGLSVGVAGASSLLGKELFAVLKERHFPVARMVTAEDDEAEPDMPVVDLREGFQPAIAEENLAEKDFDVVFVAAPLRRLAEKSHSAPKPSFLRSPDQLARAGRCTVIDLCDGLAGQAGGAVRVPFLERAASRPSGLAQPSAYYVSAHPATIVLSALLLRLAARFTLSTAVAEVFVPASEIGPPAVDELQRQTSSLLTFQKLPQSVFGRQLAFNLLPRIGHAKETTLGRIESRIHRQLGAYLRERTAAPAVRVVQAPVFHSLALSLYVETSEPAPVEVLEQALKGERVTVTRLREPAPSQAEASGSTDILVDAIAPDSSRARGAWIWAVADNLRLAAVNATEIAEVARQPVRAQGR